MDVEGLDRIAVLVELLAVLQAVGREYPVVPALQGPDLVADDVEILEAEVSGTRLVLDRPEDLARLGADRDDVPHR